MMIFSTLRFILTHPLCRGDQWNALKRYLQWQFGTRLLSYPVVYPFAEGCKLLVERGMAGATGNIYVGLHDFEEMSFVMHLLRPGDLFADIGANIGSYSILASGVCGAKSISFEPIPTTFQKLLDNVSINHLGHKIISLNIGLGDAAAKIRFTSGLDTVNHVWADNGEDSPYVEVQVDILDDHFVSAIPILAKLDVEGFEFPVLKGASKTFHDPGLKALIIELNGSGTRYGYDDMHIHKYLVELGMAPYVYSPFERRLAPVETYNKSGNTIYVRDRPFVEERLSNQRRIRILNTEV